jgi:uncharacterized protein
MKCPACENELTEITAGEIKVDICKGGCGGVWFDWFELSKVDEPLEYAGEELLNVERNVDLALDFDRKRFCPRCEGMPMMRHFFSFKRQVTLDECPQCAGFWLDTGELTELRSLFPSEEQARAEAQKIFGELIENEFAAERQQTREKLEKARRFAHAFRFICPSYYIPGKQEGAPF